MPHTRHALRVCHTCQGVPSGAPSPIERLIRDALPEGAELEVDRGACLDRCDLSAAGHTLLELDGVLYGVRGREDILRIVAEHIGDGRVVATLRFG